MRKGAGIKNKLLQAWAMGMPVVATPAATGGLLAEDGRNILIRDDADSFAAALVALLKSPRQRLALGEEARSTVEAAYSWDRQAIELENVMHQVARRRSRTLLAVAG
jgi:glycosyltransferase involved in cell wall biosynthesis